jgi:transposase
MKQPPPLRFFVGVDCGSEEYRVCVLDENGKRRDEFSVGHGGKHQGELIDRLRRVCGDPSQVGVALEAPRGALIEHLLEQGFVAHSINPKQLDRFRDRHSPAGAKDDSRDALVLAGSLRTDIDSFRRLEVEAQSTIELRDLNRLDEDLKKDFRRAANQLWEQLHRYYPQLLELCSGADEPWIWALLKKAPRPAAGARLSPLQIGRVLSSHRVRRLSGEEVAAVLRSPALQVAPGTAEAASNHALKLVARLELLFGQIRQTQEEIEALLEKMATPTAAVDDETNCRHRDAAIVLSLPGIGPTVGATMLSEAAEPLRKRDYHALRCYAGTAPVTRQSGKRRTVAMRRGCNPRLRQALFYWSRASVRWDPHSSAHYATLREAGHGHARALRGVADRLLHLLIVMLRNGTLYDPERRRAGQSQPAAA